MGIVHIQVHIMMKLSHRSFDLLFAEHDLPHGSSTLPLKDKVAKKMLIFKTVS